MNKYGYIFISAVFLLGCNYGSIEEQSHQFKEENITEGIRYGEQIPQEKALEALTFNPKQLSEDSSPFPIKKKFAILTKTEKPSEIIELGYGGYGHGINIIVENTTELNKEMALEWEPSMKYEKITLENGESALYGEGKNSHQILWVEDGLSYFMNLIYKERISPTPERFSKTEIIKIVNSL